MWVSAVLALSLFGWFDIRLPSAWTEKMQAAGSGASFAAPIFMGLAFSLASFTCTVAAIGPILASLKPDDLMLFTADHGNDPTWPGTDHTRERVPVIAKGPYSGQIGIRGFVDVAASVAAHLGVPSAGPGQSFI